ncbi:MAG: ferritin-like domain-containing protein [Candidatus Aminicenantaceae bacterium]
MSENQILEILKGAILLEHKGKALYNSVISTSQVQEVKDLFSMLAREEEKHIEVLNKQFSRISKGEDFDVSDIRDLHGETLEAVLTEKIKENISGAGYEAAVISAALEFEKKSVEYYSDQASKARSEDEKKLFKWLTDWEKDHMMMLARIDDELKEKIWFDNKFWPLD